MNIHIPTKPTKTGVRYGLGFKSKNQLPWIMVWKEWYSDGEVIHGQVLFTTGSWGI